MECLVCHDPRSLGVDPFLDLPGEGVHLALREVILTMEGQDDEVGVVESGISGFFYGKR